MIKLTSSIFGIHYFQVLHPNGTPVMDSGVAYEGTLELDPIKLMSYPPDSILQVDGLNWCSLWDLLDSHKMVH